MKWIIVLCGLVAGIMVSVMPLVMYAQVESATSTETQITGLLESIANNVVQLTSLTEGSSTASSSVADIRSVRANLRDLFQSDLMTSVIQQLRAVEPLNSRTTDFLNWVLPGSTPIGTRLAVSSSVGSSGVCPVLARNLGSGSTGDDVSAVQRFLKDAGYFNGDITGYFGLITQAALQQWQSALGIVSSGGPDTTGWGMVGPRTRQKIAELCGGTMTIVTQPVSSGSSCTFASATYQTGTMVVPCIVSDPLSACFGGVAGATSTHPVCKNGLWVSHTTGEALSKTILTELESIGGIIKTIYDPQGILSL